ncbi:MAG: AAA family ATPase [Gammaproteobacteria bacterium]|nr:AAA family ATPase [Gammaproteobacteria bacterium]
MAGVPTNELTTPSLAMRVRNAVHLHNVKYPARNWILSPWLKQRMLVLVHAPTGVGKSWFCWSLAVGIASGKGFADWACENPAKVLIIDGEMQPDDLQDRLKFLMHCLELSDEQKEVLKNNLLVIARQDQALDTEFPDLHDPEGQEILLDDIRTLNPEVVILDNLSTLADLPDENAASSYNSIFKFLTRLKQERTGILVHHDRKGSTKDSSEGYRGSSKMAAIFEQRIHISKVEDHKKPKDTGACFYTEFKKNRYLGDETLKSRIFALHPDEGWTIQSDEDEILTQVAEAVRSCTYISQAELGEYFGHQKAWANKKIRKCMIQGLLTESEWLNSVQKAKEKQALEAMDERALQELTL